MTQTRKWSLMTVGAFILLLAVGWLLLLSPARALTTSLQADKVAQDEANAKTREDITKLRQQFAEIKGYRTRVAKLEKRIPMSAELPKILRQLEKVTDGVGVQWSKFDPQQPKPVAAAAAGPAGAEAPTEKTDGLYSVQLSMEAFGNYKQMEQLLRKIEDLPRAFLVTSVTFSSDTSEESVSEPVLSLKLAGQVYTRSGRIVPEAASPSTPAGSTSGRVSSTDNLG